ncbi:MAG: YggS family pyridoxal phosphate-dependent enzyme [Rhodothermaceae bacterium]
MIKENLEILQQRISAKCKETGRNLSEVKLIAVSKYNPVKSIQEVFNSGYVNLGENKAQEFSEKAQIVKEDVTWHFIGHLQTNKVKLVVPYAEYIHSVETTKLANEINKRAALIDKTQKIFLEVNTSGEESKFGLQAEDKILEFAEFCKTLSSVDFCGLMTMAPYTDDEQVIRNCFRKVRELKDMLSGRGFKITELSMGMTNDLELAIEEGATMLRIGTAIFGQRDYSKTWKDL